MLSVLLIVFIEASTAPLAFAQTQLSPTIEKRVALVIGVGDYGDAEKNLPNSLSDAKLVSDKLKELNFQLVYRENLKDLSVSSTLNEFKKELTPGSVAFIYFSGHGMQVAGVNYLLLQSPKQLTTEELRRSSIVVNDLIRLLVEAKTQYNIILLDACRESLLGTRATGLAEVVAPVGTIIGLATYPGGYSYDLSGVDVNSLYTKFLAQDINKVNATVEQVLKGVGKSVYQYSSKKVEAGEKPQQPWLQSSLYEDFFLNSITPKALLGSERGDIESWYSVKDSGNIEQIENYLQTYPKGQFVLTAKKLLSNLQNKINTTPTHNSQINDNLFSRLERDRGQEKLINSPIFLDELDAYIKNSSDPIAELTDGVKRGDVLAKAWWCALATHERYRLGVRAEAEIHHCRSVEAKGYPIGKFLMARAYLFGRGVTTDIRKGRELLEKAVKAANPVAQNLLGDLFFEGFFTKDISTAIKLYKLSAASGNFHAQNNLGVVYLQGSGVRQDLFEARSWFKKAAIKGDPWAQVNLGALFLSGKGGVGDSDEGFDWIKKSADQSNVQAWLILGKIYEQGIGRNPNNVEAANWYRRVINNTGDQELIKAAQNGLNKLGL